MPRSFPPISSKVQVIGRFGIPEFEPLLNRERAAELLQPIAEEGRHDLFVTKLHRRTLQLDHF
jgi:hypothetical protein